jgi:hypothetical protein
MLFSPAAQAAVSDKARAAASDSMQAALVHAAVNPARRLVRSRLVLALLWLVVAAQQLDFAAHAAMQLRAVALGALFGDVCTVAEAAPPSTPDEHAAMAGADCTLCLAATMPALPHAPSAALLTAMAAVRSPSFTTPEHLPLAAARLPPARAPPLTLA